MLAETGSASLAIDGISSISILGGSSHLVADWRRKKSYLHIYNLASRYIHVYIWDKPTEWGLASSGLLTAYDSWQGPSSSSQNPPTDCSCAYNIFQIPTTITAMSCICIYICIWYNIYTYIYYTSMNMHKIAKDITKPIWFLFLIIYIYTYHHASPTKNPWDASCCDIFFS